MYANCNRKLSRQNAAEFCISYSVTILSTCLQQQIRKGIAAFKKQHMKLKELKTSQIRNIGPHYHG